MNRIARITVVSAALCGGLLLTACEDTSDSPADRTTTAASEPSSKATAKAPATTEAAPEKTVPESGTLPDVVGMDLQAAQDTAQAAGFFVLDDQDASGEGRLQVMDRNWTVCSQEPEAGEHSVDTSVVLYAVKDTETC